MKNLTKIHGVGLAIVLLSSLGAWAFAGETCTETCPVAAKVTALLDDWKTETASVEAMPEADRAAIATTLTATKAQCPVGSRLGTTMTVVQTSLATTIALSESMCTDDCPMRNGSLAASDPAAYRKGKALLEQRARALEGLRQLATYTATACNGCCADAEAVPTSIAADDASGADDSTSCVTGEAACPIRVASKIGELKADWTVARREAAGLADADRRAIFTSLASVGEKTKVTELVPASVLALTEGFDALQALDAEMHEWAATTPALADLPAEAQMTFMMQSALLDETRGLLHRVTDAMHAMSADDAAMQNTASARR